MERLKKFLLYFLLLLVVLGIGVIFVSGYYGARCTNRGYDDGYYQVGEGARCVTYSYTPYDEAMGE